MRVITKCNNCGNELKIRTCLSTRVEWKMKHGDTVKMQCSRCKQEGYYSIEKFKSKRNKLVLFIGVIILVAGTPIIWIFLRNYILKLAYTVLWD